MSDNGRISLLFLFNLLLYFFLVELNNALSGWSVSLHLDALLLVFFGLYLTRSISLIYSVLLGFLSDAAVPAPVGTYLVSYLGLWLFFVMARRHIRLQHPIHLQVVALIAQILLILALSIRLGGGQLGSAVYWQRILLDLLFSSMVLFFLVWPICAFQKKVLYSLGWDLEAQMTNR